MHMYHFMALFHSILSLVIIYLIFEVSVIVPELFERPKLLQNFFHVNFLRADCFWQNLQNICDVLVFNNSGMEIHLLPLYEAQRSEEHVWSGILLLYRQSLWPLVKKTNSLPFSLESLWLYSRGQATPLLTSSTMFVRCVTEFWISFTVGIMTWHQQKWCASKKYMKRSKSV